MWGSMEVEDSASSGKEALNVLLRMTIDAKTAKQRLEKSVRTVSEDYSIRMPERDYKAEVAAACTPNQLARLCLSRCLGVQTEEEMETPYHKQLKSEVSALRQYGDQLKRSVLVEGLGEGSRKGLGFAEEGEEDKQKTAAAPPHILTPLFDWKKSDKQQRKDRNTQKEAKLRESEIIQQLLAAYEGTKKEKTVHSIIQFFEGNAQPSREVRRLEFENRKLCASQRLHDAQTKSLHERIGGLEAENLYLKDKNQQQLHWLQTQKEATQQELHVKEVELSALKEKLKTAQEEIKTANQKLSKAEEKAKKMEAALEAKTKQCLSLSEEFEEKRKSQEQSPPKLTRKKPVETETGNAALTEALVRLEKLAWTCEFLGNEKLVALESYKQAKAKEALARSEVEVYKKYLDELTEERDHYYHTAIKTKKEGLEKETFYKSREESLNKDFHSKLHEKDKEMFAMNEKQILLQNKLNNSKAQTIKLLQLIKQQRILLKKAADDFKTLSGALKENNEEAQQLKKLVHLVVDRMKNHVEATKALPVVEEPQETVTEEQLQQALARLPSEKTIREQFEKAAGPTKTLDVAAAVALSRRLGFAPSYEDIEQFSAAVAAAAAASPAPAAAAGAAAGAVKISDFIAFCLSVRHIEDTAEGLAEGFSLWDLESKGLISADTLKYILKNFGEPLTDEEADIAFKTLIKGQNPVDYQQLCNRLMEPSKIQQKP